MNISVLLVLISICTILTIDKTLLKTLNAVEEKIDTKKIQADTSKYIEYIINKLLIKMIEQANEKGKEISFLITNLI